MSNDITGIGQSFSNANFAVDYQGAAAKKALDVQKQAGNNAIDLIKSANLGNKIDIKA
jgi:hypothetical protein